MQMYVFSSEVIFPLIPGLIIYSSFSTTIFPQSTLCRQFQVLENKHQCQMYYEHILHPHFVLRPPFIMQTLVFRAVDNTSTWMKDIQKYVCIFLHCFKPGNSLASNKLHKQAETSAVYLRQSMRNVF